MASSTILQKSSSEKQKFNYRHWMLRFWVVSTDKMLFSAQAPFFKIPFAQFQQLPFPKAIADYLQRQFEIHTS